MLVRQKLPRIRLTNTSQLDDRISDLYTEVIHLNLKKFFAPYLDQNHDQDELIDLFASKLPVVNWSLVDEDDYRASLTLFFKFRIYSTKFVYDIISKWLVPGKNLNISLFYGIDFEFEKSPDSQYIMMHALIEFDGEQDLSHIRKNIPLISRDIEKGVASFGEGIQILESKDLDVSEKSQIIQERLVSLVRQKPSYFDRGLIKEMQQFLALAPDEFKQARSSSHLTRLLCWRYLFKKSLSFAKDPLLSKRLFRVKCMLTHLNIPYQSHSVLGVLIGLSYLRENESFARIQVEKGLKACLKDIEIVPDSYIESKTSPNSAPIFYIEIKRKADAPFKQQHILKLKNELGLELKDRIEHLTHPVFMPRNEEEIMRNILNLNKQLKSHDDIPQIIIQFDRQDEAHVMFAVILLRVTKSDQLSVQELCEKHRFAYEFIPDRIKIVGKIKKGVMKEANVFYIRLSKQPFLRKDHSLDLYKARQEVLNEIYRVFNDVRDYNGGMIAKESEIFNTFKRHLSQKQIYNEVLLENFFYSLTPVIVRTMLSTPLLEAAYEGLIDLLEEDRPPKDGYLINFSHRPRYIFAFIVGRDSSFKNIVHEAIEGLKIPRLQIVTSFLEIEDAYYFSLFYHSDRVDERKRFCDVLNKALEVWDARKAFVSR